MTGLAAIAANNGWAMAVTGACIVMAGLTVLATIISQLPKIIALFEKTKALDTESADAGEEAGIKEKTPEVSLTDLEQTAAAYEPLIERLEQPFSLRDLYKLTAEEAFPHPHLTIKSFREKGKLVPDGGGMFFWDPQGTMIAIEPPASITPKPAGPAVVEPAPSPESAAPPTPTSAPAAPKASPKKPAPADTGSGTAIKAPMPGMIIRYEKQIGDTVSKGDTVVILEAMKMENSLPAPVGGTITSIHFASGNTVAKEDTLCVIG